MQFYIEEAIVSSNITEFTKMEPFDLFTRTGEMAMRGEKCQCDRANMSAIKRKRAATRLQQ